MRRSPSALNPPDTGNVKPVDDARVEDVEVEVDEDLAAGQRVGEPARAVDLRDAVRLEQHLLAGVDVAHAAHDDA